jgi:hypothetical protein
MDSTCGVDRLATTSRSVAKANPEFTSGATGSVCDETDIERVLPHITAWETIAPMDPAARHPASLSIPTAPIIVRRADQRPAKSEAGIVVNELSRAAADDRRGQQGDNLRRMGGPACGRTVELAPQGRQRSTFACGNRT